MSDFSRLTDISLAVPRFAFLTRCGTHRTVHHASGEYVRYEDIGMVTTNTIENVFSVFRRGIHGVYQHCGEAHLHRYLNEFAFRYNSRSVLNALPLP